MADLPYKIAHNSLTRVVHECKLYPDQLVSFIIAGAAQNLYNVTYHVMVIR